MSFPDLFIGDGRLTAMASFSSGSSLRIVAPETDEQGTVFMSFPVLLQDSAFLSMASVVGAFYGNIDFDETTTTVAETYSGVIGTISSMGCIALFSRLIA